MPGTGDSSTNGFVPFNPARELQRAGLLLVGDTVYISWASYCDLDPYHGWIIGYDAQTLQQVAAFNATPNGSRGGLWMGGAAPAADADGAIYCVTGNGTFDPSGNPQDFGDSFLKLTPGTDLTLTDYFTPFNQASLSSADEDLGSGGAVVLPDSVGSALHPRLLAGCGKAGVLYLLNRDRLGHYLPTGDSQVVQEVPVFTSDASPHFFGLPAYFNGRLYLQPVGDPLKAFAFSNGTLNATPVLQSADQEIGFRGATPSISANGTNDAVAWELVLVASGTASLRAYDADDLAQKLYDSYASAQAGAPDQIGFVKFAVPTIANGKVYVGTGDSVAVFGLRFVLQSIRRGAGSGGVQLVFQGPAGIANRIEASTDLRDWTDLGPGTPTGAGTFSFTDATAGGPASRFYRVVQP